MFMKHVRKPAYLVVLMVVLGVGLALWNHVPAGLSERDITFIQLILSENGHADVVRTAAVTFEEEIEGILAVQDAVLAHAPVDEGLALGQPREPETLYRARRGLCYDRSRVIEKALTLMGFETRHVAVYSTATTGSAWKSLLTPGIPSHAVSEVRTRKGWLMVDSNARFVALTAEGMPLDTGDLAALAESGAEVHWTSRNSSEIDPIFMQSFTYVIGLYSRHGRFYPPYVPVPDINFVQLLANVGRI